MKRRLRVVGNLLLLMTLVSVAAPLELEARARQAQSAQVDNTFDSDGVPIHYTVRGQGEPVLLIHGFAATYAANWEAPGIMQALEAAGYQVVAFDARGHGQSGKPHDPAQYGSQMGEDAVRLLNQLGIGRAHIVGYSMGGLLTNRLLEAHPERFLSASLGGAGWAPEGRDELLGPLAEALEQGSIEPLIRALTPLGQPQPSDQEIQATNALVLATNDPLALAAVARGGFPLASEASLRRNEVPTLALIGELDPIRADVDEMADVMRNLEVVVIEDTDHLTALVHPKFIESLLAFLAAN
jgi:pimeloyl-ACP methyl ester carboxylesterase